MQVYAQANSGMENAVRVFLDTLNAGPGIDAASQAAGLTRDDVESLRATHDGFRRAMDDAMAAQTSKSTAEPELVPLDEYKQFQTRCRQHAERIRERLERDVHDMGVKEATALLTTVAAYGFGRPRESLQVKNDTTFTVVHKIVNGSNGAAAEKISRLLPAK